MFAPVYADDDTTIADAEPGTEFPLLQAYANLSSGGNVQSVEINDGMASTTVLEDSFILNVPALDQEVTFTAADNQGDGLYEQTLPGGTAYFQSFMAAAGLSYTDFGFWEFAWSGDGGYDIAFWAAGFQTRPENMPSMGTAEYNGGVVGGVSEAGVDAFTLEGDVTMTADFGTGAMTGGFNDMTATSLANGTTESWNSVTFSGSIVDGTNGFGGTLGVTGENTNPGGLAANATGELAGQFFGPDAEEVGGAWQLGDGTKTAIGSFGAKQ